MNKRQRNKIAKRKRLNREIIANGIRCSQEVQNYIIADCIQTIVAGLEDKLYGR